MSTIRAHIAGYILATSIAGALSGAAPAAAHPGHAPAIITIDRPASGSMYVNDVQQGGSVQQVGTLVNPAVTIGSPLTIKVSWACPPQSTGARVLIQVRNANGAIVHGGGLLFTGPSGSTTSAWPAGVSGQFRIETQVTCTHTRQGPNGTETFVDGADGDFRDVIALV